MDKEIHYSKLHKGSLLTIIQGPMNTRYEEDFMGTIVKTHVREDRSFQGDVLEFVYLEYPFIFFKNHSQPYFKDNTRLNLKDNWKFRLVSKEYCKASGVNTRGYTFASDFSKELEVDGEAKE